VVSHPLGRGESVGSAQREEIQEIGSVLAHAGIAPASGTSCPATLATRQPTASSATGATGATNGPVRCHTCTNPGSFVCTTA